MRPDRRAALLLRSCLAGLGLLVGVAATADPQSKSWSSWSIRDGQVRMSYTIPAREVTRLPAYRYDADLNRVLASELLERIAVSDTRAACAASPPETQQTRPGYLQIVRHWQCPPDGESLVIDNRLMFTEAPGHIHFARLRVAEQPDFELLFTRHQPRHAVPLSRADDSPQPAAGSLATIGSYTLFGFEHILIGLDHIAFLLTLMLFARRLRDVLLIVTGFTVGHSVTLSLAVLGLATPEPGMVEALIGFTIIMVAVENVVAGGPWHRAAGWTFAACAASLALLAALAGIGPPALSLLGLGLFSLCYLALGASRERARALRPAITTLFGLVHGFGFAGVLLEVGLPENAVVPALFGFNLGVEIGQVALVCAMTLAGRWLLRSLRWRGELPMAWLNAGLCGLGVYWFVQRLYF
jgi:hypothetical protein